MGAKTELSSGAVGGNEDLGMVVRDDQYKAAVRKARGWQQVTVRGILRETGSTQSSARGPSQITLRVLHAGLGKMSKTRCGLPQEC